MKTNDLADQTKAQQHKKFLSTTTDHAWDIGWLEDFFEFLLDSTGQAPDTLTCDSFKKYFFQKDNSGNENRLEAVFNSLASEQWMRGFVLMTKYMNTYAKNLVSDIPNLKRTVNNRLSQNWAVTETTSVEAAVRRVKGKTDILQKMCIGMCRHQYQSFSLHHFRKHWLLNPARLCCLVKLLNPTM